MHLLFFKLRVLFWHLKKLSIAIKTDVKIPNLLLSILDENYDVYKTNVDLHGRWHFITSIQIFCSTKKNTLLEINSMNYIFPNYVFGQNLSFSMYKK